MEKRYFPMFVDISDKKIVVVGGGTVAARRVKTLLDFAEDITVVSPEICEKLRALREGSGLRVIERGWRQEDLAGAQIVLAATDQKEVNAKIVRYCREHRIPVNTADDKSLCDFYFPSIIKEDPVIIGINSGGISPAKVKETRQKLERALSKE